MSISQKSDLHVRYLSQKLTLRRHKKIDDEFKDERVIDAIDTKNEF